MVQGLSSHEVLRFASVIAVGMTLMLTASASYFLERRHGQRPLFALTLTLIAWCTLTLGTAMSGVGKLFPPVLVAAPILSGYTGPAIFIYTRQLTMPHKPTSLRWFWMGIFGTIYSALALTIPNGLDYATQAIVHQTPYWHPILSPFMTVQSIQLVAFIVLSTVLITRAFYRQSRPDLRRTQLWLLVTCWTCLGIVVLTSILPSFNIAITEIPPAVMTLPIALVGLLSVRSLGKELERLHAGQTEMRAGRMESLGRMARGLAHDLNNILTAVVGHAELARLKVENSPEVSPHLTHIINDSERAAELLNRMMAYSGRVDRTRRMISAREPLEAAFESLKSLHESSCTMVLELAADLPFVGIDENALASAIENLLSNSVHAMDGRQGQITLRAFVETHPNIPADAVGETFDAPKALRIEVEDTGRGMTTAEAMRALEPFYSARKNGKGLGLVSVLSTVKGAGGVVWFSSEVAVGTRFVLWLPLFDSDDTNPKAATRLRPLRTLLVDDERKITDVLAQLFDTHGVESFSFSNGEDAIEFLARTSCPPIDFAVVDIRLDKMDGIELGHRLIYDHALSAIVLMSGDEPGPRLDQFSNQPVTFIRKPITTQGLTDALGQLGFDLSSRTATR